MRRDPSALEAQEFDVAVVGGGIFGICAALEAAQRGLTVALVERGDFCALASAHSFRMVHGGIRYIQHGDLPRIRESVRERRALFRMAPHLVQPLPIGIPTFGHGIKGPEALRAGMLLYDLCAADRNRGIGDAARRIPGGRIISRAECLRLFPELEGSGCNGAGVFYDGQMYNPPRLALAILRSAVDAGAVAVNYVAARGFRRDGNRVTGIEAADVPSGAPIRVRARLVVNTAGAWAPGLLEASGGPRLAPGVTFSRDTCFVLRRRPTRAHALALLGQTRDPDALLSRAARHLFLVPWQDHVLLGVWHKVWRDDPDAVTVTDEELATYLAEVNASCPALRLTPDDVSCYNAGLVLFGDNAADAAHLRYGHRSRIVDHGEADGVQGLITSIGVRWTTSRGVADRVISLAARQLGKRIAPSRSETTPVHGGAIHDVERFVAGVVAERPARMPEASARALARNHGTGVAEVLAHVRRNAALAEPLPDSFVTGAEVVHAAQAEMAQHLSDVVFRRTDLGTGSRPSRAALERCAGLLAGELAWSPERVRQEIARAEREFPAVEQAPPAASPAHAAEAHR
ncbi:MAG TPA: glycerol-3-phosphate dehydrogenase/oxidase [Gemmatimonadales bacterium]|nr:glycerol-3-phosphate dehydrogenase/oxidase [Gemmatimonadales bacterium]